MSDAYAGVIIEESLKKKDILKKIKILATKVEKVTPEHHTPHLKQWTLHTVQIAEQQADKVAKELSRQLTTTHGHWYADFKNTKYHCIIFHNKIFRVDRSKKEQYNAVVNYGLTLGIPEYQLDFSPAIKEWER